MEPRAFNMFDEAKPSTPSIPLQATEMLDDKLFQIYLTCVRAYQRILSDLGLSSSMDVILNHVHICNFRIFRAPTDSRAAEWAV